MRIDYTRKITNKYLGKDNLFDIFSVELFEKKLDFYYFEYESKHKAEKSIVVTAGFDGDEIDGIVAAFELARRIKLIKPNINVTILPICNPLGYEKFSSFIPTDNTFPKHYYPGRVNGNNSEKLIFVLRERFLAGNDLWIDLHGGSKNESLIPFVSGYESKNIVVNKRVQKILGIMDEPNVIYQINHGWVKIENLADEGIGYLLSEAGDRGILDTKCVEIHIDRVFKMINFLHDNSSIFENQSILCSAMERAFIPLYSKWYPLVLPGVFVNKNRIIGYYNFLGLPIKLRVRAKNSGMILWVRNQGLIKFPEPVCEINYRI